MGKLNTSVHEANFTLNKDYTDTHFVRLQVLMAASEKMTHFWDMAPRSLVEVDRRFRRYVQQPSPGRRVNSPLKRRSTSTRLQGTVTQKSVILTHTHAHVSLSKSDSIVMQTTFNFTVNRSQHCVSCLASCLRNQ
jgi:hypothetical protein